MRPHPHDEWRARNQHLYTRLRDHLAEQLGLSAETTQNMFEQYVASEIAGQRYSIYTDVGS